MERSSFRWLRVLSLLLYLESWHFTRRGWKIDSGTTQPLWIDARRDVPARDGERRRRTKGRGRERGELESFMSTECVETAVTEPCARSLETLTDSSVKMAAPAPVFVWDVDMQACVTLTVCVWARLCARWITFSETASGVYLHFFMLSLDPLSEGYCTSDFLSLLASAVVSTMLSLIRSLMRTDKLKAHTNKGMFGAALLPMARPFVPELLRQENHLRIHCFLQDFAPDRPTEDRQRQ